MSIVQTSSAQNQESWANPVAVWEPDMISGFEDKNKFFFPPSGKIKNLFKIST